MGSKRTKRQIVMGTATLILALPLAAAAGEPAAAPTPQPSRVGVADRPEGEPIFFRWLDPKDPTDATILDYWARYEAHELPPRQMVDLGTMLFERGWPKDAIRVYTAAAKADPGLYEAWFRAGLVEHSMGKLRAAKKDYKKCLKILVGSGWCNFYMGLAEEQSFNGSSALRYYEKAFSVDRALANPKTNPAILESKIARAAAGRAERLDIFESSMPMGYLEPKEVEKTLAKLTVRERKTRMWEEQAKSLGKPAKPHPPRHVPSGSVEGASHPARRRPAKPAGAATPSVPAHGQTAPHRSAAPTPHRAPPSAVPPVPKRPRPPAPTPSGERHVYPWGGGPISPQTAPPPPGATPVPRPTQRPEKKEPSTK